MLDRAALLDMTADAIGELFGILIAQTGVGGVDDHLLVETDVGVGIGIERCLPIMQNYAYQMPTKYTQKKKKKRR